MAQWDPTELQGTINAFLANQDWSQADLARAAGISPGVVNRWMQPPGSGMLVQPTDATLRKVAPVLRVPLNELLRMAGRTDPSNIKPTDPPDLDAVFQQMRAAYPKMDEARRSVSLDMIRSIFNDHMPRRPDRRRTRKEKNTQPEEDSPWGIRLTSA